MKRLSQDDGLSQGANYFRYEDSRGFIWITGNDAVNRYDGSTVKVYNLDRYFKGCPPLQQGYGFAEDDAGNIYVGSVNGLYIYHSSTDKFTLREIYDRRNDGLAIPFAFRDGKMWCFNRKYEIATYDVVNSKIDHIFQAPLPEINSAHIYDMLDLDGSSFYYRLPFLDNNGSIWCPGTNKLYRYNINDRSLSAAEPGIIKKNHALILCTYFDRSRNQLLLGLDKGVLLYNTITGREQFLQRIGNVDLRSVISVTCNEHAIAVQCRSGTLLTDRNFKNCRRVRNVPVEFARGIFDLGFDKSGRLWMCEDGMGQIIFRFSEFLLSKVPGNDNDFERLRQKVVTGFAEMPNGDIFFQGDFLLEPGTQQLKMVHHIAALIGRRAAFRPETDLKRRGMWLYESAYDRHHLLNIYFAGMKEAPVLKYTIHASSGLGTCHALKILQDGRVLLSFSNGLFWLKEKALVPVKNIPYKSFFTINPLSNNRYAVSYLNKDMWLIAADSTDNLKLIQTILPSVQSFYVQEDSMRHRYWVGTNKGIYLLDRYFNPIRHFDANNGLAGTYIYGLLLDRDGNVWCSHQHGLSSIETHTFQITNYDKDDGIQDWDFNNRAFYKATNGTLYFGGVSGFNYFNPPLKPVSFYQPEVYVDEILVNDLIVQPDSNANEIKELHLLHRENNIVVKAIVKDLDNNNELIYKLGGTGTQWKHMPGKSLLTFNSLAPGTYLLELGVFDKYRHRNLHQKTIRIFIAFPFYLKPWFWVIVAVMITTIIAWWYNRVRLRKQKVAFRQQLALEKQRNKITADLHDDIGASLSSLQVNSVVANELLLQHPDRARKVLEKIATQSKQLSENIGDIIWSMKPGKDEFMTMSTRIRNFANDIMGDGDIQYQITMDEDASMRITDMTIRKNIVFITKEAINNAVKYSKAKNLSVTLTLEADLAMLTISDNGIGFDLQCCKGNGIINMERRTEEMGGSWALETGLELGTTITIRIPLKEGI
ncbi:sensor histidine kinase [Taibaiella koreensis]|uniref:sensor histidine kinase n=1 Tax=Taibaiella koreensis TaxID=1268548 RepID=UPI0013C2EC17|nr:ATP-binding protein [Taibaiella koreensis]